MLNFLFGKSFWSTVIRSALFLPLLSLITIPLAWALASAEDIAAIQRTTPLLWGVHFTLSLIFGAWAGWGFAYGRFKERLIGKGWFAVFPLVSGMIFGPLMFWALLESPPASEMVEPGDKATAMIFGAIAVQPMALLMSLFRRHVPIMTAIKRDSR